MGVDKAVVAKALLLSDEAEEGHLWRELESACRVGDLATLSQLYQKGADIRYQEPKKGRSALMIAASSGHVDAVKFLLEHGSPWNAQDKDTLSAGELSSAHEEVRFSHIIQLSLMTCPSTVKQAQDGIATVHVRLPVYAAAT